MVKTGWGRKKRYPLSSIDGYKKYFVPANGRLHPVIIVLSGGKKAVEISGAFTKNIDEIEDVIASKLRFLGEEQYDLLKDWWNKMLWR